MTGNQQSKDMRSVKVWRVAQVAGAVAILTYALLLACLSQTGFPVSMHSGAHWPWLMDKPVGEDGYYMLTVADNIAAHGTISYNWGIPATGIQPFTTVVFAGLDLFVRAFGGGPLDLIRTVFLFSSLLFVFFAYQLSRITASICPAEVAVLAPAVTFLLTLFDYTLFRLFTYGLETGVYLVCIAACVAITVSIVKARTTGTRSMVLLGVAAGLAGEARIDFGLLFACVLIILLLKRWISLTKAVGAGAIALLLVSPWFLFVHRVSGSWLPSSGAAESTPLAAATAEPRLLTMFVAVMSHLAPWSFGVMSKTTLIAAVVSCGMLIGLVRLRSSAARTKDDSLLRNVVLLWSPGIAVLLLAYYLLFNSSQFYYRYASPVAVLAIPVLAVLLARFASGRLNAAVMALMVCSFACWTAGSLHAGNVSNSQAVAAGYVQRTFPHAHVGSFQSGVMGFFNRNVENLDGKLNGPALQATRRHALPQFIDREGIDVLVDWPSLIHVNLPDDYLSRSWVPCPAPVGQTESICLMRKQP